MSARLVRNGTRAAILAAALTVPSSHAAFAEGCVGAPGTSALEQYCEAVPDADGSRTKPGSHTQSEHSAPVATVEKLQNSGADGKALAAIVAGSSGSGSNGGGGASSSAKSSGGSRSKHGSSASGAGTSSGGAGAGGTTHSTVSAPTAASGSALAAAREAVETGPTAGSEVTWALVTMSALGGLSALLLRRRSVRGSLSQADDTDA